MANFNFNEVILGGRLTADPELKTTQNGTAVTSFSLAVGRRVKSEGQPEADFINVTAWRQTAEFITRHFRKGSSICIVGEIRTRSYTDKDNQKRYITEVVADEARFVDAKGDGSSAPAETQPPVQTSYMPDAYTAHAAPKFDEITEDDDLPF